MHLLSQIKKKNQLKLIMDQIKFSKNNIFAKDLKEVKKVLKSGWLTHGKYTKYFERDFSKFTGSKYSSLVSNCTAGLHLACVAMGFKKNDEVIVPAQTHVATAHAVEYTGAKAIFADINLYDGNINIDSIKSKITKKTKGIIIVHFAGYPCEINKILKICKKYNLKLIEDCAHALGTYYKKKHVGNFGDAGVFSFYPTKQITTGEGGMVITNSKKIFSSIKQNKAFGIDTDIKDRKIPGLYNVNSLALNFRITDFQACLGYYQLKRYRKELNLRKKIAKSYCKILNEVKKVKFHNYMKNASYFIFPIFLNKIHKLKLIKLFKKKKVGFSIHYARPVNLMNYYKNRTKDCKNALKFSDETISLPAHSDMSLSKIKFIKKLIQKL